MGLPLAVASVMVRGDTGKVTGDLRRGMAPVGNAARSMAAMITSILAAVGVAFSISAVVSKIQEATKLIERQMDAETRAAAVIRSTGAAAGFTAKQLREQAAALQQVTTVGDEEILESQAVLLTFKTITEDTFKSATETVLDMAAVMGTNARSGAMQLGRALEDPIRGVSALRRTGVSFSEQQKEQIKDLVESNKLSEAQALVLGVVRGQLGGVAKAMSETPVGRIKQLKNTLGDVKEELGRRTLPLSEAFLKVQIKVAEIINSKVVPAFQVGFTFISKLAKSTGEFFMRAFRTAFKFVGGALMPFQTAFQKAFENVLGNMDVMLGSWKGFGEAIVQMTTQTTQMFEVLWETAFHNIKRIWLEGFPALIRTLSLSMITMMEAMVEPLRNIPGAEFVMKKAAGAAFQTQSKIMKSSQKKLEEENERHAKKMLGIGVESALAFKRWRDRIDELPKFSDQFREAWLAAIAPPPGIDLGLGVPGPEGGEGAGVEAGKGLTGRFGFAEFSKQIQDRLLKAGRPEERTADASEMQVKQLGEINANMRKFVEQPRQFGLV